MQILHDLQGAGGVKQVVVRKRLSRDHLGRGDTWALEVWIAIHGPSLMRVLPVSELLLADKVEPQHARESSGGGAAHPGRDRRVVFGSSGESCGREISPEFKRRAAVVVVQFSDDSVVL